MRVSSASPEWRTVSAYSRCSGVSGVSSSSPVMPMTPFIGVRISWLIVARNSLLARLAASAASRACRSSSSARLCAVMSLYVATKPPPRMGLSWISRTRPSGSSCSIRRGWNWRAWAIRSAIRASGSRAILAALRDRADELLEGPPHPRGVRREPHDVGHAAVPRGEAQLAVEGHQALPHALQRGLQQRRLLRHLRLAAPRHLEQPRVLQRRGGLAGQGGEQARLGLGVRVDPLVRAHQHAIHPVAQNDRRGHVGAGRHERGEGGFVVLRIPQEGRVRHAVVRPAHAPLGEGPPAHALTRADRQRLGRPGREVDRACHHQPLAGLVPAEEAGHIRGHGLGGALGHDTQDLADVEGRAQAPRDVEERGGLALAPLRRREEARVADGECRLADQGVEQLALLGAEAQGPRRHEREHAQQAAVLDDGRAHEARESMALPPARRRVEKARVGEDVGHLDHRAVARDPTHQVLVERDAAHR